MSLDWPRPPSDAFWVAMTVLVTKEFLPKGVLHRLSRSRWLRRRPRVAIFLAYAANTIKMTQVAVRMLRRGELTWFKLRQFATFKGQISQ